MSDFLDKISKLSPQRLALLADELNERVQAAEKQRRIPLAVIGMGCRFPGGVNDPEQFWELLSDGVDAIREVPLARWDTQEFYDRNPAMPGKMATRWGGFIEAPEQFDAKFFGIAPTEAMSMDPQQRLLLETSWEALEHAGIAPSRLAGTKTGVFVGICNGDYSQVALNSPREKISPYFAPGLSHAVAAGRISYVLGFQGPSMAVDTSCSASLVAVHLACQSLRLGECNAALAGGVNLILNPDITIALSQSRMMAPDGRCKAFSESANGFVRGEGCGMILLKRLPDAIRDRNRILAVIRGSACNQDGRSSGLTVPSGPSQEVVVAAALADAGMHPNDVDYIEAHGTGTSLGDPIEAGALNAVFTDRSRNSEPLLVGSVKTNLGHLESAAGIAGLMKLVLSIQHGKIPASLHFDTPNSRIEWDHLPIRVPTELLPWNRRGRTRVGGVSSFGFSGTNAHVIVEEYIQEVEARVPPVLHAVPAVERAYLFPLSAKTETALKSVAAALHRHLIEQPSLLLADIARTLHAGRSHFEFRAALVAASHAELLQQLHGLANHNSAATVHTGRILSHSPRIAFIFGGDESILPDDGQHLYIQSAAFREAIQRCEKIVRSELGLPLHVPLCCESAGPSANQAASRPEWYAGAAAFTRQYALSELWRSCGIEPSAVLGYGAGEIVAATVTGVMSLHDGLRLAIANAENSAAKLDECANQIRYSTPRIPLLSNFLRPGSHEVSVNSPDYWRYGSQSAVPSKEAVALLAKENCAACLYMGDATALQQFAQLAGDDQSNTCLASFDRGRGDQIQRTGAALYVLGCRLDMDEFSSTAAANTISLPTYPFERERYWLDPEQDVQSELTAGKETLHPDNFVRSTSDVPFNPAADLQTADGDDWIYDLVWVPKPLPHKFGASFDASLIETLPVRIADDQLKNYGDLNARLDPVCAGYIKDALHQLGGDSLPDRVFTFAELCQMLHIAAPRRRLFERMLAILAEDGLVENAANGFHFSGLVNACEPYPAPATELRKLQVEYPLRHTEMNVLARCGENLAAVLAGRADPVHLLFPNNSTEETEHIYRNSPMARYYNELIADLVHTAVQNSSGRMVRILEIGAGTGATTQSILPRLVGEQFDYTFTDISPAFLARARAKFAEHPSLDCRILNIENDPAGQGFEYGGYDVVIAANVLHATADLRRTLAHLRALLAPGGLTLLLEAMRPDRAADLTFGLTDGWWCFADKDVRTDYPLVAADTWTRLLKQAGMASTRVMSCAAEAYQTLILAQAPATKRLRPEPLNTSARSYVLLADDSGIGAALYTLLIAAGESCQIIRRPDLQGAALSQLGEVLSRSGTAPLEIVYLWGTDISDPHGSLATLSEGEELCVKTPAHIIQAMLRQASSPAHLWLITCGAQATSSFSPGADGAAQSMMWGVGRALGLENLDRYRRLIDLAPDQSPHQAAQSILAELLADDLEDQIAYRAGQRLVARLKNSSLEKSTLNSSQRLRRDGAYLVAGALGGIGLRVSRWAAAQGAGHLVLLGRTGTGANAGSFAAERSRAVHEIRELGAHVTVVEADVASEADMKQLFQRFGGEIPPLCGIFHMATVWGGARLSNVTDQQIETMLRPKVLGTWVLHELTKNLDLEFFLTFSSAASLLGAKGMAHYAAANQFLDSFAHFRRAAGLPMLSVNWGTWDVMRLIPPEEQTRLSEAGVSPMQSEKVLSLFGDLISSNRAQVMIASIDWNVPKAHMGVHRTWPLLEDVGGVSLKSRNVSRPSVSPPANLHNAIGMLPEGRRKYIESFVLEQAARVLGFRRGEFPPADVPLTDLGLDSLMAVDLKNHLQSGLGRELSPTIVFDFPTVSGIVGMLDTMLWAAHSGGEEDLISVHKEEIRI